MWICTVSKIFGAVLVIHLRRLSMTFRSAVRVIDELIRAGTKPMTVPWQHKGGDHNQRWNDDSSSSSHSRQVKASV